MANSESILARLIEHNVKFVVVGGFAAMTHGCTLLTIDIDVCCDMSAENLLALQKALSDIRPIHRMTPDRRPLNLTQENCRGLKNLYLDTDDGQIDCLGEIKGIGDYEAVKAMSEKIDLPFGSCSILSLDGIIKAKSAMDRPRDKETVLQLKVIKERQ